MLKIFPSFMEYLIHPGAVTFGECEEEKLPISLDDLLGKFTNLEVLDISNYHFHNEEFIPFIEELPKLSKLKSLTLSNINLTHFHLLFLARILEKLPLVYLNISNNPVTNIGVLYLSRGILKCNHLKYLSIANIRTKRSGILPVADRYLTETEREYLSNHSRGFDSLFKNIAVSKNLNLQMLDFRYNFIDMQTISVPSWQYFCKSTQLKYLLASQNFNVSPQFPKKLAFLDLSACYLNNRFLRSLCNYLSTESGGYQNLKVINLAENHISDPLIVAQLILSGRLTCIDFTANFAFNRAVLEALMTNTTLQKLCISRNNTTSYITDLLRACSNRCRTIGKPFTIDLSLSNMPDKIVGTLNRMDVHELLTFKFTGIW